MNHINEKDFFETTDMSLVATLYYFGYKIDAIDRSNLTRAVFIVLRDKELDAVIQGFWARNLQVEPSGYFNSIKEVKTRLYQN